MKDKFFYPYLKLAFWLSLAVFLLTIVTGSILRLTIKQANIEKWIQKIVTEQTGGVLEFRVENFDILHKIKIRDIVFRAPQTELGFHEGGLLASKPLITLNDIEIVPHLSNVWRGLAQIKRCLLEGPAIVLDFSSGQGNITGLAKYRARKFPPELNKTPWYQLPQLPINLDKIFIPGKISLQELLVSNLNLEIISDDFRANLGPYHAQLTMESFARSFYLALKMGSKNSEWKISLKDKKYQGQLILDNNLVFDSWTDFKLKGSSELRGSFLKNPLKQAYQIDSKISGDLSRLSITQIKFDLENFLQLNGHLSLESKNHTLLDLDTETSISGKINFSSWLTENLGQIFPMSASGRVDFDLNAKGKLNITDNFSSLQLPEAEINLNARHVNLSLGKILTIKNFESVSNLNLIRDGDDALFKPQINMDLETFKLQLDQTLLMITRPKIDLNALVSWKALKVEELHSNVMADSIELEHQKTTLLQDPLKISIGGQSGKRFSGLDIKGLGELGKLFKIDVSVNCSEPCERIKVNSGMKADDLMGIVEIAKTKLKEKFKKYLPSYLNGSADAQVELSSNLPDLRENFSLQKLDMQWKLKATIPKVDMKIPFQSANFQGMTFKLGASGDLQSAVINTTSSAEILEVAPTLKLGIKAKAVNLDTDSKMTISSDWAPSSLKSETKWRFGNKTTDVSYNRPYRIADNEISGNIKTIGLQTLSAQVIRAAFIGGGVLAQMNANLDIPHADLNVVFSSSITPSIMGSYFAGLMSSGSIETSGKLRLKNWNGIVLEAKILFKKLSAMVDLEKLNIGTELNGPSSRVSPLAKGVLKIGMIDGALPIYFNERVDEIKKWFQDKVSTRLDERIDQYLQNEDRINNLSLVENNIVSWKDGSLAKRESLRVQDLLFNNVGLEELDAALEISSKALMVKNYQGRFLGGRIHGSVFVPLSPLPERVKWVSHVSGIDSALIPLLVGKKSLKKTLKAISGNFHVDYFTRSNSLDGVFDLTSIGAEQMNYVLELVDPDHADPAINNVRRALVLGSLNKAKATIDRGALGLDLDVRLAGVPLPIPKIGGVNLSNVIDNLKSELFHRRMDE